MGFFSKPILIYRGVNQPALKGRAGKWWTTNPYYALRYSKGEEGTFFYAITIEEDLKVLAKDVSIEAEFQNYFLAHIDPPGMKIATQEQIDALRSLATYKKGSIGGTMMRPPTNSIEVGFEIFG